MCVLREDWGTHIILFLSCILFRHLCVFYLSLDSGKRQPILCMDHSPGYKQISTEYQNGLSHTRKHDCVGMPTFTKYHYNTLAWLGWKQMKRNERICNVLCVAYPIVILTDYLTFALASDRDTLTEKKLTNSITLGLIRSNESTFLVLSLSQWVAWSSTDTFYSNDWKHKFSDSGFCKGSLLRISTQQTNSLALKESDSVAAASKWVLPRTSILCHCLFTECFSLTTKSQNNSNWEAAISMSDSKCSKTAGWLIDGRRWMLSRRTESCVSFLKPCKCGQHRPTIRHF